MARQKKVVNKPKKATTKPKKVAKPTKRAADPLVVAWRALEKRCKHGTYAANLEPTSGLTYEDFDLAPLLPPAYVAFVKAVGYPWVAGFGFLPPRWMKVESMGIGVPEKKWDAVRAEREANTHRYQYVMFASHDLNDTNGFAFGPDDDGQIVVWNVEDSLPESPLGPFAAWLAKLASAKHHGPSRDPLDLLSRSLSAAEAKRLAKGGSPLSAFKKTTKEINFDGRTLRELPAEIGEYAKLESLNLSGTGLRKLPRELGKLAQLESLDLSWNQEMEALPNEIGGLRSLRSLDLGSCWKLRTLPREIGQLTALEFLDLTHCESFESLPLELGNAKQLGTIFLFGTKVSAKNKAALAKLLPSCEIRG